MKLKATIEIGFIVLLDLEISRIKGMYMQLVINYSKYKAKIMIVLNPLTELIAYFTEQSNAT
jgi:hypothetical protein